MNVLKEIRKILACISNFIERILAYDDKFGGYNRSYGYKGRR